MAFSRCPVGQVLNEVFEARPVLLYFEKPIQYGLNFLLDLKKKSCFFSMTSWHLCLLLEAQHALLVDVLALHMNSDFTYSAKIL